MDGPNVWRELQAISRDRKHQVYVAVPFLGSGGGKLLRLKEGDVLVVALTEANSRNGSVCPAEIKRLQRRGVRVFLAPYLHAKVMRCGRKAVIGSANLSQTSFNELDEAAVLTTDSAVVRAVRDWFRERTAEPITPEWLAICGKAYRPPKGGVRRTGNRTPRRSTGRGVWLLSLVFTDHPEDEAVVAARGEEQAKRNIADEIKFKVVPVRWTGHARFLDQVRKGDSIVQVMSDAGSRYVEEVARLIGIKKTESRRGTPVTYLYLESRRRPKTVRWIEFKRHCASFGLAFRKGFVARELVNSVQAAKVLSFVSRREI